MKVTKADVLFGIERLLQVYPKPKHGPQDVAEIATVFLRELDDLEAEAFRFGLNAYCKTETRYFPKPGELRGHARGHAAPAPTSGTLAARYLRWEQEGYTAVAGGPFTPCPVCAAVVEFGPRVLVRHDHQLHYDQGVPYIGPRTGPVDKEGHMLPASGTTSERTP